MNSCLEAPADVQDWALIADQWLGPVLDAIEPCGLDEESTRAVVEVCWLRLSQHIDVILDDAAIGAWLIVQAEREAARVSTRTIDPRAT